MISSISVKKNIVVVLPSPMGDAILCTPGLRLLRSVLVDSRITFLASATVKSILSPNPWADMVLSYDDLSGLAGGSGMMAMAGVLRRYDFDAAIVLPNSFRSAMLVRLARIGCRIGYDRDWRGMLLTDGVRPFRLISRYAPISMLDYYGHLMRFAIECVTGGGSYGDRCTNSHIGCTNNYIELFTSDQDRLAADALFDKWCIGPNDAMVMMVPGGAFGGSKWWAAERFACLADMLSQRDGVRVVVSCSPNKIECQLCQRILAAAKSKPIDLAKEDVGLGVVKELIARSRVVVSNDTGPCHIAAAFGSRLVTFFGPTDPRWTATGYSGEKRIRYDVECGPCQEMVCRSDHRCMELISVDQAYAAVRDCLEEAPPSGENMSEDISNNIDSDSAGGDGSRRFGAYGCPISELVGRAYRPYDEHFLPLHDGSGIVHEAYQAALITERLGGIDDVFQYEQGQRLDKPGLGIRERFRVRIGSGDSAVIVYLKRYGRPSAVELLRRVLARRSRAGAAVYDFSASMTLAQCSVSVARPIAFGQELGILGEKRSFVLIEELPNADALERLLPESSARKHDYNMLSDKRRLVAEIAALVGRLHGAGYFHRDLYLSHIFLGKDRDGREMLSLIDLQRVFKPMWRRQRWQVKDLAQLYYSSRGYFTRSEFLRFLRLYLGCSKLTSKHKRLANAVYRKAQRIARHDRSLANRHVRVNP